MSAKAETLLRERALRDSARAKFDARLAGLRADIESRGVGGRIADSLAAQAKDTMDEAIAIANDNKGIVAGTLAALLLWFLRNPIISGLDHLLHAGDESRQEDSDHGTD